MSPYEGLKMVLGGGYFLKIFLGVLTTDVPSDTFASKYAKILSILCPQYLDQRFCVSFVELNLHVAFRQICDRDQVFWFLVGQCIQVSYLSVELKYGLLPPARQHSDHVSIRIMFSKFCISLVSVRALEKCSAWNVFVSKVVLNLS